MTASASTSGPTTAAPPGRGEAAPAARAWSADRVIQWSIFVIATLLVIFPLAPILFQSVLDKPLYEADRAFTLNNYTRILSSAEFWSTVGTTLVYGLVTTILAVVIGTFLAVVLTRTDVPAAGWLNGLLLIPFYVSPLVLAFAWAIVYGPSGFITLWVRTSLNLPTWELYTIGGMAVVAAVYYVPYTYLYSTGSLALTDPQGRQPATSICWGPTQYVAGSCN